MTPTVTSAVRGGRIVSTDGGLDVKATSAEHATSSARPRPARSWAQRRHVDGDRDAHLDAHIGTNAVVDMTGAITVEATDNPEADATNLVSGEGFVGTSGSLSAVTVTPVVQAYIGSGSLVSAGAVEVKATSKPDVKTAGLPTYAITGVNASSDTITVAQHNLQTGDVIEYQSGNPAQLIGGLQQTYTDPLDLDADGNPVDRAPVRGAQRAAGLRPDPDRPGPDRPGRGRHRRGGRRPAGDDHLRHAAQPAHRRHGRLPARRRRS